MNQESQRFMRGTLIHSVCCFAIVFGAHPRAVPNGVEVRFALPNTLTLHEPVVVLFEVHNGLAQPITVTLGGLTRPYFEFSLTTPDGRVLRRNQNQDVTMLTIGTGKITVAPGADYKESLPLSQWFPFTLQGAYSLASKLTSEIETESGDFAADGQLGQLHIVARSPARLNQVCADLAGQVQTAPTADAAQEPARTLSYVDDEVAVPYLARVLATNTLTERFAVAGLERIGNDDAVEVLLSAVNSEQNAEAARLAATALARMQERIASPRLKERVKKAVERSSERARHEFIRTQIAYLDYRSPDLQRTAIQTLTQVQDGLQQAEPVLQRLANDPNQPAEVRAAAQDALKKLQSNN